MIKSLLHRQWRTLICLAVLFCFLLLTQDRGENSYFTIGYSNREAYLSRYDPYDADGLFAGLHEDYEEMSTLIDAIEAFEEYEGEIPDVELDIMDILSGSSSYMTYDMLIWKEQMLKAPGQYTDTVEQDDRMLRWLSADLSNQENFEGIIENQREIMRRGIRRGGPEVVKYEKVLDSLSRIEYDFPIKDTLHAVELLNYLENDWYILVLLAVMTFSFFSTSNQQKVTNQVLVSRFGMRRFARAQIVSAMIISGVCMALYYLGVALIQCEWDISTVPWSHPIQAIVSYENILQDMTIFEYMMANIGLKMLFCFGFVSIVLLISSLSPNNIVSFAGTAVLLGCVYMLVGNPEYGALAIGNGRGLFEELCYVDTGYGLVHHAVVFGVTVLAVISAALWLIIAHCDFSARKWVK